MNEFPKIVHGVQRTQSDAQSRFGLVDLALFVLGHLSAPTTRRPEELECLSGTRFAWARQANSSRMAVLRVLCRMRTRFQTLWSLPADRILQFSRKDAGFPAND